MVRQKKRDRSKTNDPRLNRREFLKIAGSATVGLPFLLANPGCAPSVTTRADATTGLFARCVCGEVTPDSAMIWLRAEPRSQVSVYFGEDPLLNRFASTGPVQVAPESDDTAKILLKGLEPGRIYYYRAAVIGKKPGPIGRFVTAPRPEEASKVSFCFSGDTRESYQPFTIMSAILSQRPDFFLHLGDTVYADRGGRARHLPAFWQKHRANHADFFNQQLFSQTSVYAVWDDHEVEDNYLPNNPLAPIGRQAFLDYWPMRPESLSHTGIDRSFRWGQALELFLLDTRQYRDYEAETMLGKEQKEWLFSGLASSTAAAKIIATSVPMYGGGRDRWDGFPKERKQLLRYIADKKLRGVAFLSADMHYAAVSKIPDGNGLKEITAGPLAAPMNVITNGAAGRFEFFSNATFNFAKLTVDPKLDPTRILVEFFDEKNQLIHRMDFRVG